MEANSISPGSAPQEGVTLTVEINLTKNEEYKKSTNRKINFPEGKNYLSWFKQPTHDDLKCRKKPGTFSQFDCALGTLDPGEIEFASIEWDQELPAGVNYSYNARLKPGHGEYEMDGLLADNNIKGSGRVVEVKTEIVEDDTGCTSQQPDGQVIIKTPLDGSDVTQEAKAFGSFKSIPAGMEIWAYSRAPAANRYWLMPVKKYGETSGTWTVKGLNFGRPGKADIGFTYEFGVALASQCTSNAIRKNPSRLVFLPDGVKVMDEVEVERIGE